jgi:hypothetical protein
VIIFLHSINQLEFVRKTHGVFREVETETQYYTFRQITDWDSRSRQATFQVPVSKFNQRHNICVTFVGQLTMFGAIIAYALFILATKTNRGKKTVPARFRLNVTAGGINEHQCNLNDYVFLPF